MTSRGQTASRASGAPHSRCLLVVIAAICVAVIPARRASGQTVAEVDGEAITARDLERAAGQPLATLEEQEYLLKQQKLDELIGDRLMAREAARRHLTLDELAESEIGGKLAPPTAAEIHALFELNRTQLPGEEAQYRDRLDAFLRAQKTAMRRQEFINGLRSTASVSVHLAAPEPFRADVAPIGPSRGPAGAPVTIVAFEDFQCPYCKQAHETLERILERYDGRIRLVHRDFPLDALHPAAWKAHEAARCAADQGKFWEYRTLLYANAPAAAPDQLKNYAVQAGVDPASFIDCVEKADAKRIVQTDVSEGERLGITGTPAFFVNGRLLSGAQPESEFARVIDQELERSR